MFEYPTTVRPMPSRRFVPAGFAAGGSTAAGCGAGTAAGDEAAVLARDPDPEADDGSEEDGAVR